MQWLKIVKEQFPEMQLLNENVMERVIEELERGWNVLTQPLRKLQQRKEAALYPDEVPCEICGESDTSNCNVIVLCDDCDLAVHQECYGVPHIPEGPWLCRPCSEKKSAAIGFTPKCMLCPWPGGALRKTSDHRWVHSLCAHLVPETAITFAPNDPHDLVDTCTLQSDRAKLRCVLCRSDPKIDMGYPVQCSSKMCHVAFHPMCARSAGWTVQYSNQKAFCCKHTPDDSTSEEQSGSDEPKLKLRLNLSTSISSGSLSPTKSKYPLISIGDNCPLHVARSGEKLRIPTFAPKVLIEHISNNLELRETAALRYKLVQKIAKYWALKRESRRGTPLLKSLQLEPGWSQTDEMSAEAFEKEWTDKMSLIRSLRSLKEKVDLVRRREVCKLSSLESSLEIFEILSSPFTKILINLITKLQKDVDPSGYFAYPVPCDLFPDYPLMIDYPMDFSTMIKNLKSDVMEGVHDKMNYPTLLHFYADLKLIWENSRTYNTRTSVFYQAADRLENYSKALLSQIKRKFDEFGISGPFDILTFDSKAEECEEFDFDGAELPTSTPARFPKSHSTPIEGAPGLSQSQSHASSASSTGLKRRGRPPKPRDVTGAGSIDSIASNEDGQLSETVAQVPVQRNNKVKIAKKRGRPSKKAQIVEDTKTTEIEEEEIPEVSTQKNELKNLFWAHLKNGNWCPCELFTASEPPASKRPKRSASTDTTINVRLFDATRTILSVEAAELKPLTEEFEKDLEELEWEGVVSRKSLANSHRLALSTLYK